MGRYVGLCNVILGLRTFLHPNKDSAGILIGSDNLSSMADREQFLMAKTVQTRFVRFILFLLFAWLIVACSGSRPGAIEPTPTIELTEQPQVEAERPEAAAGSSVDASDEAVDDSPPIDDEGNDLLSGLRVLTIDPAQSEARFLVDEVLLGEDKTVVGVTSYVTGTISVDPTDPHSAEISTITIDARDLTTDNSRRNRSIQRQVLRSVLDEYRFITFEPTAIEDLPDTVTMGEPLSFTVRGNLTVRGVTRPETFDLTVTALSPTEISGSGTSVIRYEDYDISIPSVPAVASVEDEVRLELAFVAVVSE